ncbi:unnamed protein product [Taenia asiatica]|uniref:IMD domain-containing protein n=1 Tax=Taenia asiatica TaxID=60517 RepID=A0A0R3WCJ9_TAEAS|nr:unnamed protein product [Taenia asiatica]
MGNSLTRFGDVGRSLGAEPSSELSWCSRSLSRIAESSKFFEQQNLVTDAQALLSHLDDILTTLGDLIAAESDVLSVSINRSSGRLSGLHIDISMDSKNRPSSQGAPLNNSSLLSKSQASSYSAPTKGTQSIGGKDDEIGEVMEKSTGLSPNATADVAEFGTNGVWFLYQ